MTEELQSGETEGQTVAAPPAPAASEPEAEPLAAAVSVEDFHELTQQVRGLQGSIKKTDDKVSGNSEIIARYKAHLDSGLKPAEAEKAMAAEDQAGESEGRLQRIEDMLSNLADSKLSGTEVNVPSEATRLIQEFELDANSPEVNAVLGQGLEGMALENALLRLNKPKNAASAPPPKPPEPVREPDEAALANQYVEELRAAGPDRAAASRIREKYEKLKLDTGAITFH